MWILCKDLQGKRFLRHLFLAATFLVTLIACGDGNQAETVDFSQRITLVKPEVTLQSEQTLRVAVGAMISPQKTFTIYHQLVEYIGHRTDRPYTMVQRRTYGEINRMLGAGKIDLAFICAGPYTSGREAFGFDALAVPIVGGAPYYRAYLIVHRDSPFQTLADLRDRVFAFTDPESNTGRLVPTFWLQQIGARPETFFRRTIYSFSHDNAILAVSRSLVDGAAVHSQIWEYLQRHQPETTARTRVIKRSRLFGNPPMVASRHLDKATRSRIRAELLRMHQDEEGGAILTGLMIDRFAVPREEWYESVEEIRSCL
jgi:phosphonate transport system substrate-binding protein